MYTEVYIIASQLDGALYMYLRLTYSDINGNAAGVQLWYFNLQGQW